MLFDARHLANDRQACRRTGRNLRSVAEALRSGHWAGEAPLLERSLVVPVLTAHPTEVRRKSMIDHRNRIAELMRLRDAGAAETAEGDLLDDALRRQISLLWQTRPLRRERLYVADEVEIALSYLRDVFLPVLPTLYARWQRALGQRPANFVRLGTWIGGDRDGNPGVNAASLRRARPRLGRCCSIS